MIIGVIQMTRSGIQNMLTILLILLICSACGKRGELVRPKFNTANVTEVVNI